VPLALIRGLKLLAVRRGPRQSALERIDDEVVPYFGDDPARSAFPDDGRLDIESCDGSRS
jgi:hypothetical protein